jgi:hypothetical protein
VRAIGCGHRHVNAAEKLGNRHGNGDNERRYDQHHADAVDAELHRAIWLASDGLGHTGCVDAWSCDTGRDSRDNAGRSVPSWSLHGPPDRHRELAVADNTDDARTIA